MGRKRLITDSFRVVKKRKRDSKEVKENQSPLHADTAAVETESSLQDLAQTDEVELLKQFDLSWQYGPCTGITRLQRWERAKLLGLSPPITVRELLLKYNMDPAATHSINNKELVAPSRLSGSLCSCGMTTRSEKSNQ